MKRLGLRPRHPRLRFALVPRERDAPPPHVRLDLGQICDTVDQVLELVRREWRPQENRPNVNDWNDEFLVAAFARAFRCLRSVREIACRGEADDAAVLTRALIALTLRYLWIGRAPGEQRRERLERLRRRAADDRATLGEELELVAYLPAGTSAEMLGLALISFATLADFSEPVVRHGLTQQIGDLVQQHHQRLLEAQEE